MTDSDHVHETLERLDYIDRPAADRPGFSRRAFLRRTALTGVAAGSVGGLLSACKAALKRAPALERAARSYGLPLLRAARIIGARRRRGRVGRRVSV